MYYLIYKTTNILSGKFYVGSHKTKNKDDGYMGSGKYLNHAIKKHGLANFRKEILFEFATAKEMYDKEAYIVDDDFLAEENTYNLKQGGFGGFDYINNSGKNIYGNNGMLGFGGENLHKSTTKDRLISQGRYYEYINKISTSLKDGYKSGKLIPPFLGKTHKEETLQKLRGHTRSNGCNNSQFGMMWITNGLSNLKIKNNDSIPISWYKGRTMKKLN